MTDIMNYKGKKRKGADKSTKELPKANIYEKYKKKGTQIKTTMKSQHHVP